MQVFLSSWAPMCVALISLAACNSFRDLHRLRATYGSPDLQSFFWFCASPAQRKQFSVWILTVYPACVVHERRLIEKPHSTRGPSGSLLSQSTTVFHSLSVALASSAIQILLVYSLGGLSHCLCILLPWAHLMSDFSTSRGLFLSPHFPSCSF